MEINNMGKGSTKPAKKWVAMITYIVALICLLLGLLVPLANVGKGTEAMLALQLPNALNTLVGKKLLGFGKPFTYSFGVNFFGLMKGGKTIDLGAIFVLLYAVITVAALIGLIPVLASKKTKTTALKTASVIEALALIALFPLMIIQLELYMTGAEGFTFSYALLIAFGGTALMLIVQAFAYKKGSGVIKFILLLLSAVAILLMFPVGTLIPKLSTVMDGKLNKGLFTTVSDPVGGEGLTMLNAVLIMNVFNGTNLGTLATNMIGVSTMQAKIMMAILLALAFFVFLNFLLDMIGLAKKTNKGLLVCNLIRYIIELALVIAIVVFTFLIKEISAQIYLYVLAGIALLQLIVNIVRLVAYCKKYSRKRARRERPAKPARAEAAAATRTGEVAPYVPKSEREVVAEEESSKKKNKKAEPVPAYTSAKPAEESAAAIAAAPLKKATPASNAPADSYYNVEPIYNGPTDDFIKKLTNSEKIEFAQVFIERRKGNLHNIPEYNVGGNNAKFFSAVFIYFARVRDLISGSLMNKIYEQGNMME